MRPAAFGAEALSGAIAQFAGQPPGRAGFLIDMQVDIFGAIRAGLAGLDRIDRDAGEQAGRDQRLAQIVDLAAVIKVAFVEAGDPAI